MTSSDERVDPHGPGQARTRDGVDPAGGSSFGLQDDYEMRSLEISDEVVSYMDWVMAELAPYVSGHVLEIGAGIGTMSRRLLGHADDLVLVEPARNLYEVLAARFANDPRVTTHHGEVGPWLRPTNSASRGASRFDSIVMVNVLEHIDDDVGFVRMLPELLAPSGRLVLFVPSLPVLYGELDRTVGHFRRYTRTSLRTVVEGAGLQIERLSYFDLLGSVPWFVVGRLLRRKSVGGEASWYDKRVVPLCRLVDRLGPPLGKNLICVAVP